ncbi:aspartic peptidase domain-containing protein [Amylostereum chailletii]|nr:aspartic peptidase domain-containing protein [Amylostereum chailletii]
MDRVTAFLLLLLVRNVAASDDVFTSHSVSLTPTVQADAVSLPAAPFVLNLSQKVARPSDKAKALRHVATKRRAATDTAVVFGTGQDEEYSANITIGGQSFAVIIDTGSSDTWLVKEGFSCFTLDDNATTTDNCAFGSAGFVPADSPTYKAFPDHNFNISYGDGEFITGDVGFETVTVGGLTVTNQEIGVVDNAAWTGDGVTSGLIGLCYPGLTSVYTGDDPNNDSSSNRVKYNPFFFTAIAEGAFDPPVKFSEQDDAYVVPCNATAPPFSVVIGGKSFNVTSADIILPIGTDDDGNLVCNSGIADGGSEADDIYILGDTFLHNIVATFNLDTNQMVQNPARDLRTLLQDRFAFTAPDVIATSMRKYILSRSTCTSSRQQRVILLLYINSHRARLVPKTLNRLSSVDPSSNMSSPITVIGSPSPSPPPLTPDAVHLQLKAGGDIPVAQPLKPANEKLGAVGWKLEGFIGALNSSPPLPHMQPDATVEIPVTQPPKSTKEEPGTLYERHETFFLDDGSVTFLVGNTLYRPHRFFFVRDSPWFAARLSTATAHAAQPATGAADAKSEPITLDGVTSQDFDAFLSIIYPSRFDEHDAKTQAQWHSVLKLAHMWSFSSIRALAILHLDRCISPFDRLVYARMYGIEGWVVPALTALCSREDPLEVEEVEQMQARDIALVADVREQLRIPSEQSLSNAEEKVKSWLSGATKTTRLCTKRKKEAEERDRGYEGAGSIQTRGKGG